MTRTSKPENGQKREKDKAEPRKKLGIYIHIPFCVRKCFYCDFYSEPLTDYEIHKRYVRALIKEIFFYGQNLEVQAKDYLVDSIFIGGGTPSVLNPELIREVLKALAKYFSIDKNAEITIEANPATLDQKKLEIYRAAGINRLSIGAQSFDDRLLFTLGRAHNSRDIEKTVEMAREAGFDNLNLDLMFGVPDQTLKIWKDTVCRALELRPEHISFYSLELSENTLFYQLYQEGRLKETPEARDRAMYHRLLEKIRRAGYSQYEISNGALPGYLCRHNLKYWDLQEYLSFGASAHSYMEHTRFANMADSKEYIAAMERQDMGHSALRNEPGNNEKAQTLRKADCVAAFHRNSYREDVTDFVFTALRRVEGINLRQFEKRFKNPFWELFPQQRRELLPFVKEGFAEESGSALRITEKGFDVANQIISIFL